MLAVSLVLGACAADASKSTPAETTGQTPIAPAPAVETEKPEAPTPAPTTEATKQEDAAASYEDIKLTFVDAYNIYMEKYPDTKVKQVDLDQDYGNYVYEVEGYDGTKEYELKINPVTGDIIKEEIDSDDDKHYELTIADIEKVDGIIEKALKEAGEGFIIQDATVKNKKGSVEVEIELDKEGFGDVEYTYNIDGTLIEIDS